MEENPICFEVKPSVQLIAKTSVDLDKIEENKMVPQTSTAETLVEFAGRNCYKSFHRPSEATSTYDKYISRTVHGQEHYSILEHVSATFYVKGVTRAFLAEISRHRHLSFSVESQRFVNETEGGLAYVVPPIFNDESELHKIDPNKAEEISAILKKAVSDAAEAYNELVSAIKYSYDDISIKKVREAARAVLPNCTSVDMVVTGNLRAWLEVLNRRTAPDVDQEFQLVAMNMLEILSSEFPSVFEPLFNKRVEEKESK